DIEECKNKIIYYLENENEREDIARRGQNFILENYNYHSLMKILSENLKESYYRKFEPEHNLKI
ncbi:MAG TPA: glycosyltransferase, partial [Ignavibacteria bacterium]|nr:glycosyltransferase [Ignavibacteria bacterium]